MNVTSDLRLIRYARPTSPKPKGEEIVQQIAFAHGPKNGAVAGTVAQQRPPDLGTHQHPDEPSGQALTSKRAGFACAMARTTAAKST